MKWFVFAITLVFSNTLYSAEPVEPTRTLNGTDITYKYTSGRSYNVRFEEAGVSYRYLTGSRPEKWWGPFPYKAFEVADNIFIASWFEKGYGDYVTLHINFNDKLIYGSAIISSDQVHFHGAKLLKVKRP